MLIWVKSPHPRSQRFLFLDRDGVINEDRPDYVKHWNELRFYPEALEALRRLREREVNVILISNQSALHRGLIPSGDFWELHRRMIETIQERGGELLATFYCPHRPDEKCACRKPSPEMLLAASRLFAIPLADTFMIGDKPTDLEAGARAGCRGILLQRFSEDPVSRGPHPGVVIPERCGTLSEAVAALLESG